MTPTIQIALWHTWDGKKTKSHVVYNDSSICGLLGIGRREIEILDTFSLSDRIPPVECKRCENWLVQYVRRHSDLKKIKSDAKEEPMLNRLVEKLERAL